MSVQRVILNTVQVGLGYGRKQRRGESDRPALFDPGFDYDLSIFDRYSDAQRQRLAMANSRFYANITTLAYKIGKPRIRVQRVQGEGREDIIDHPFERLLRRPNPVFDRSALMQYSTMWLGLDGNAYWYLTTLGDELEEIWPIPAREMRAVPHPKRVISHYEWRSRGQVMPPIPVEKIVHFRIVWPFSVLHGAGFVQALRYTITGNMARQKWNLDFFDKRRGLPEGALSVHPHTDEGDVQRMREQLQEEYGGGQRRIAVIRAGEASYTRWSLTQEEMDFLAGMEYDDKQVDTVCGFPGGYWDAKANRANAEQADRSLAGDRIDPMLESFAGGIEAKILDPFYEQEGEDLTCSYPSQVSEDQELALRKLEAEKGAMTFDELRARVGLPGVGGEVGATPVALLPALAQMIAAGFTDLPDVPTTGKSGGRMMDDLRNWRQVALKCVARAVDPGERDFYSDAIPWQVRRMVEAGLAGAADDDAVNATFGMFLDSGVANEWRGYP